MITMSLEFLKESFWRHERYERRGCGVLQKKKSRFCQGESKKFFPAMEWHPGGFTCLVRPFYRLISILSSMLPTYLADLLRGWTTPWGAAEVEDGGVQGPSWYDYFFT